MPSADDVSSVPDADAVGTLDGIRVDERAENVGLLLLASPGADVIKVEPPGGSPTRTTGLFVGDWVGPDRSVFFARGGCRHR